MRDDQGEAEPPLAFLAVDDRDAPGRHPVRDMQAPAADAPEILHAAEHHRAVLDGGRERHADTGADAFLEARRTRKSLRRADDLRQPSLLVVEARPGLA